MSTHKTVTRRDFLKTLAVASASLTLADVGAQCTSPASTPAETVSQPEPEAQELLSGLGMNPSANS